MANKIQIEAEELIMLEAFKTMRKVAKTKGIDYEEKTELINKIFRNSNKALNLLGVD